MKRKQKCYNDLNLTLIPPFPYLVSSDGVDTIGNCLDSAVGEGDKVGAGRHVSVPERVVIQNK
jgi:hypothetical protein